MTITGRPTDTPAATDVHPFLTEVENYAESVLRPRALATDATAVAPERITEFATLGLLNHLAPAEFGGAGLGRADDRRLHEIIAGACPNTWLVWAQHAPIAARLIAARDEGLTLPDLALDILRGERLAGAALSDVRRFPDHYIRARRITGGWVVTGRVSWVSGWGLNSVLTTAAIDSAERRVVTALIPVTDRLRAAPLELAALTGSRTERVFLDEVFVPDENVLSVQTIEEWHHNDVGNANDARPHHFGLAESILNELSESTADEARALARAWRPQIDRLRSGAYQLIDAATDAKDPSLDVQQRLNTRVATFDALSALSRALLVARAGHGIARDDTAQFYARTILFFHVQGQNATGRAAQLTSLTPPD
ncbi:acyl-CoA dehydrogenase family protein [Gordonia sp. DT30]|uniref:acyl-CoA dehydrogenase family protein n=1 Tax=Gordonia sp. DT30 TaxID=3416546 RepID=UPI003CF5D167